MNTTVVVHNLPTRVSSSELEDLFSVIGDVLSVNISRGVSLNAGTGKWAVEMSTREAAENCILYFQRQSINGMKLVVSLESQFPKKKA